MSEAADVGASVSAFSITDRHFDHLEVQLGSPEDEIKVSEGIEISEIASVPLDLLIVFAEERLGAAQGVFEPLIEYPREHEREEPVT